MLLILEHFLVKGLQIKLLLLLFSQFLHNKNYLLTTYITKTTCYNRDFIITCTGTHKKKYSIHDEPQNLKL